MFPLLVSKTAYNLSGIFGLPPMAIAIPAATVIIRSIATIFNFMRLIIAYSKAAFNQHITGGDKRQSQPHIEQCIEGKEPVLFFHDQNQVVLAESGKSRKPSQKTGYQ